MAYEPVDETGLHHERIGDDERLLDGKALKGLKGIFAIADFCFSVELCHPCPLNIRLLSI
jgi:hypothetical protein